MLSNLIKVVMIWMTLILSGQSFAGSGGGFVEKIIVHTTTDGIGVVMFTSESNANKAACSTTNEGRDWAFSLATEQGKAMYALLLSAQAQHKAINVLGKDLCVAWHDREEPNYIYIRQ